MPELPEVTCVSRQLNNLLPGHLVHSFEWIGQSLRDPFDAEALAQHCANQEITEVIRRAKYIIINTQGGSLLIHLGMTGSLRIEAVPEPQRKHTHWVLGLTRGSDLTYVHYVDPRRFGRFAVWPDHRSWGEHVFFSHLGLEPLENMAELLALYDKVNNSSRPIKSLLMDQSLIVGAGNIYASELLFRIGISPLRPCNTLTKTQWQQVCESLRAVLLEAIECGGSSIQNYIHIEGKKGSFSQRFAVYGREGLPCRKCSSLVLSIHLAGRSTFYCPKCQR